MRAMIRACGCGIWAAVSFRRIFAHERMLMGLLIQGKLIREFKNSHSSHIFDVKFDTRRIVRCVFFSGCPGRGTSTDSARLGNSTSHDRKIVILDFADGLAVDPDLFI